LTVSPRFQQNGAIRGRIPKALTVWFAIGGSCLAAETAQEIYAKYATSIVTITTLDECLFPLEQGSGIIIKTQKEIGSFILTNYHVIRRASLIVVKTKSGAKLEGSVCYFDEQSDIALLRTGQIDVGDAPQAASAVETGSRVFTIGTPHGLGWTISDGIVSAVRVVNGSEPVQFTAPMSPGSSGGPLFDAKGDLIGITSFKARDGENLNFAIRLNPSARKELEKHLWRGERAEQIRDGDELRIGHFEESQAWMERSERAKSWNAHTTVIKELFKESAENNKSISQADRVAEHKEVLTKLPNERAKTRGGLLSGRLWEAGAARFELFPEDSEGWELSLNAALDSKTLDRLLAIGIKKWPHSPDVLKTVLGDLTLNKPDAAMKIIEEVSESLPSRKDIDSLLRSVASDRSETEREVLKDRLEQMAAALRLEATFVGDKYTERSRIVAQTLVVKGWKRSRWDD
jgi:serine protease Do